MASGLRQRQQQRQRQGQGQGQGQGRSAGVPAAQHLDFVTDREYNPPLLGIQRSTGLPVSVLERGNTQGMSATWLVAGPGGIPMILTFNDLQLTGSTTGLIPPPVSQLEAIFDNVKFEE